jgi:hypothetical protein
VSLAQLVNKPVDLGGHLITLQGEKSRPLASVLLIPGRFSPQRRNLSAMLLLQRLARAPEAFCIDGRLGLQLHQLAAHATLRLRVGRTHPQVHLVVEARPQRLQLLLQTVDLARARLQGSLELANTGLQSVAL